MAKYLIKMLKDEEGKPFVPLTSTDGIKDSNGTSLEQRLLEKLGPANLLGGKNIKVRTEGYNCYIDLDLPSSLNIINNLNTNQAGEGALDAYQGKVLKDSIPGLVNSLESTDATKALSANQGKILKEQIDGCVNLNQIYPVGSVYTSISPINPHDLFGGSWTKIEGRFLWATVNTPTTTGGSQEHTHIMNHTHTVPGMAHTHATNNHTLTNDEIPTHKHNGLTWGEGGMPFVYTGAYNGADSVFDLAYGGIGRHDNCNYNGTFHLYTGLNPQGNGPHNHGNTSSTTPATATTNSQSTNTTGNASNMPPYFEVYMWYRTA